MIDFASRPWVGIAMLVAFAAVAPGSAQAQGRDANGVPYLMDQRPRDENGVPAMRAPERVRPPRSAMRKSRVPRTRRLEQATVPTPQAPYAGRIQVPEIARPNETFSDRVVRCRHYGTALGVPQSESGVYIHNCAM